MGAASAPVTPEHLVTPPCGSCRYHPRLNVLYVLSECIHQEGYITAYSVDAQQGDLVEIGRLSMTGKSTCYMSFDKDAKHAVITNYWDGILNVIELDSQGVPLRVVQEHQQTRREEWRQVVDRAVSGRDADRDAHSRCRRHCTLTPACSAPQLIVSGHSAGNAAFSTGNAVVLQAGAGTSAAMLVAAAYVTCRGLRHQGEPSSPLYLQLVHQGAWQLLQQPCQPRSPPSHSSCKCCSFLRCRRPASSLCVTHLCHCLSTPPPPPHPSPLPTGSHVQPPGRPPRPLRGVPPLLPLGLCARPGRQWHPPVRLGGGAPHPPGLHPAAAA
jgi:hypothetical protein